MLTLHEFWAAIGHAKLAEVCALAGVPATSFKLCAYRIRNCSPEQFEKIEKAAKILTPDAVPGYEVCTRPSIFEADRAALDAAHREGRRVKRTKIKP